ncbi:MAG: hypothetical protein WC148_00335 [Bacilli bacterium]
MKKYFKNILLLMTIPLIFSCSANSNGDDINENEALTIVNNFVDLDYKTYSRKGKMNFLAKNIGSYDVSEENIDYVDTNKSFYLSLPTHINSANWEDSYLAIKNRFLSQTSIYNVYIYQQDDGLSFKVFSCNKRLIINRFGMEMSAKWNASIDYDKNGYLLSENFSTINAYNSADNECIYGNCVYEYNL